METYFVINGSICRIQLIVFCVGQYSVHQGKISS